MSHVAVRPRFGKLLRFSLARIWYPLWLIPFIVVAMLLPLRVHEVFTPGKGSPDTVAPYILAAAILAAVARWYKLRHPFLIWLAALLLLFFIRELHFENKPYEVSTAFVLGNFLLLMFIAWHQYPRLASYLGSRLFLTLISTTFMCYLISVGLDKHWWKFLPGDKYEDWQWVEEYVEIAGHLLLLLLAVMVRPTNNPLVSGD